MIYYSRRQCWHLMLTYICWYCIHAQVVRQAIKLCVRLDVRGKVLLIWCHIMAHYLWWVILFLFCDKPVSNHHTNCQLFALIDHKGMHEVKSHCLYQSLYTHVDSQDPHLSSGYCWNLPSTCDGGPGWCFHLKATRSMINSLVYICSVDSRRLGS